MSDNETMLRIAAAYIRVSTEDQVEYSPDSQLKVIRDYAKREGYLIPDDLVFQDDGISGKSADKRPAFRVMIAMAKEDSPQFDSIFVWKYSRFARNQEEAIMYKNLLKKKGITVRSISEPSSDSPFASLIERIIEWMDEYYLINLSEEVRRGMKEKAQRGEAMGKAPFGYSVKDKMFVPDENAEIVRYVFEQYASGVGYRTIAMELVDKGIQTQKGKRPCTSFVEYMLHNPAYIGKIRWNPNGQLAHRHPASVTLNDDVIYVDGKHEALIDMDTWNTVQERLLHAHNELRYRRRTSHVFMLKGIIRCGTCGATLIPIKNKYISYQCCNYGRGVCKVSHSIRDDKAEALVIEQMERIIASDGYVFSPPTTPKPEITRDWGKLIQTEEQKLDRARTAFLEGVFEGDEYKKVKAGLEKTIERLKAEQHREEGYTGPHIYRDITAFRNRVLAVLEIIKNPEVDPVTKNESLRSIIEKIMYNKPENTLDFYFWPE